MVQEADVMRAAAAIPDELYNLTQLAEVTLAASKLSTTNLQQIKAYFRHEESEEDDGIVIEDRQKVREAFYAARPGSDSDDSYRIQKYKLKSQYWSQRRAFESVSSSPNSSSSCLSMSDEEGDKDGVIYNYSHKIFDRRKSRKITEQGLSDDLQATESNEAIYGLNHLDDLNSSSEDIHSCPECGKKYSTSSNLARHRQTHRWGFENTFVEWWTHKTIFDFADPSKTRKPVAALIVIRSMSRCPPFRCMCERIIKDASALIVESAFRGHGSYRDTFGPILVRIL